ncbi:hypothetical protein RHSIM_Rhsim03G0022200 [Rhododendron simsii]|uniref:HTH three-helical bundle domain-containing protein n=1 Tax=Rhododendron simsii TaxID=118357 RepID=A0A834H744_RHOSS|nr:hypothetical protein RHSIM_Rhsim03G0022200 [Rhododendron simsii]
MRTHGRLLDLSRSVPSGESKLSVDSEKSSLALSASRSCSSTVTNDDGSSAEARARPLRMIAAIARCHDMKISLTVSFMRTLNHLRKFIYAQVVRKSRSKKIWRCDTRKLISIGKPIGVSSERGSETTSSSCLSSSSSAVSTGRSRGGWKKEEASLARNSKTELPRVVKPGILRRRAEAIKRLLSNGCTPTSEVRIRQLLGDSPDTSKALRMLLKHEEIKRSGAGGRSDPYLYMVML